MAIGTRQGDRTGAEGYDPGTAGGRRSLATRFVRDRLAMVGLAIVLLFGMAAIAAPALAPHDPAAQDAARRMEGPSLEHPLGTDQLGRDTFSRILFGARWSLGAATAATLVVMVIGLAMGALAGYAGGFVDTLLMRIVDVFLALPTLVLALAIVGTLGPGLGNVMIALVSVTWVTYARVVRGLVLAVREREFVQAAFAMGASDREVMIRHILPNVLPPVVVLATLETGKLVLALAALGFFGLGVQPPTPEWGTMLNQGRPFVLGEPQLMLYPGAAITLAALGFNLMGDGLRDLLDPRLNT